jgi:hypothetical protein
MPINSLPLSVLRELPTVSVEIAGAALGLGRASAYAAARRGEIPTLRLGKKLAVPTERLLKLLEEPADQAASAVPGIAKVSAE